MGDSPLRVLLAGLDRLPADLIEDALRRAGGFEIVSRDARPEALAAALEEVAPDLAIVALDGDELPAAVSEWLLRATQTRVVAFSPLGDRALAVRLVPIERVLPAPTADDVVAAALDADFFGA